MSRKVPKYIIKKIEKANELMQRIVELNIEMEDWIEKQNIEDGYDFLTDYRESRGYEIYDVEGFIARLEEEMN